MKKESARGGRRHFIPGHRYPRRARLRFLFRVVAVAFALSPPEVLAQTDCDLYPIALGQSALAGALPGSEVRALRGGTRPGNFGWLTWSGSPSVPALTRSLIPPGDSSTYVNGADPEDHVLSVGDWVQGKPGVSNSRRVRDALEALGRLEIMVPVWDEARLQGNRAEYRVSAFARIQLIDCELAGEPCMDIRFLGWVTCGEVNRPPAVDAGPDRTLFLTDSVLLEAVVTDDGLPVGGSLRGAWTHVSGPGLATFSEPTSTTSTVRFDLPGTHIVRLTVTDGELSAFDEVSIEVGVPNLAPVAHPQVVVTDEDLPVTVTLSGLDPDGDVVSFEIVTPPARGTLEGELPVLCYTPIPDFNGADEFLFQVNDGTLDSEPAAVQIVIHPVNDPPLADDQTVVTAEDTPVQLVLTGEDTETSHLTYVVTQPPHRGELVGEVPTLDYVPHPDAWGADAFSFLVSDGEIESAPATVALWIEPVNDPPRVEAGPDQLIDFPRLEVSLAGAVIDPDPEEPGVAWSVTSGPGMVGFLEPFALVTIARFSEPGVYQLVLTAADAEFECADNVRVMINQAPVIEAGPDQTLLGDQLVTLAAAVADDGLPPGVPVTVNWSVVSGPGTAAIVDPDRPTTRVSVDAAGIYVLRLTASDSRLVTTDELTITVRPPNEPPRVYAGDDVLIQWGDGLALAGVVTDDGRPAGGGLSVLWSQASGPGAVHFTDPTSLSSAVTFDAPGVYALRLTAHDSELESSDELQVIVNAPPHVNAGSDRIGILPGPFTLEGAVTDDNLPYAKIQVAWSRETGPGIARFSDPHAAVTEVQFTATGEYQLRLTATDGLSSATDVVRVTVRPAGSNLPPIVDAGPDRYVALTRTVALEGRATDDGLPVGASLEIQWRWIDGPAPVEFSAPNSLETTATVTEAGQYRLRLTVRDTEFSAGDDVVLAIYPDNQPPSVDAGPDQTVTTGPARLAATACDDGRPEGQPLAFEWTKIDGPGQATFDTPHLAVTRARFSEPGEYVLAFAASDTEFTATDTLTVTVTGNQPPRVDAGVDQVIDLFVPPHPAPPSQVHYPSFSLQWQPEIGQPGLTGYWGGTSSTWVSANGLAAAGPIVYAAGSFLDAGGLEARSLARWNGCAWSALFDPRPIDADAPGSPPIGFIAYNGTIDCVAARGPLAFVAGGFLKDLDRDGHNDFTACWNGTEWISWGFDIASAYVDANVLFAAPDAIYFGGTFKFRPSNDPAAPISCNIAKWNGEGWERLGDGIRDLEDTPEYNSIQYAAVHAIALAPNGDLYVGGRFTIDTPTGRATHLTRWNGQTWAPVSDAAFAGCTGYNCKTEVLALATGPDGALYVGGNFTQIGDCAANFIAAWDGSRWSSLGSGLSGTVDALTWQNGELHAAGNFLYAEGRLVNRFARWDGTQWQALDSGLNARGAALTATPSGVYVGGRFSSAGAQPAGGIAKWGTGEMPSIAGPDPITVADAPGSGVEVAVTVRVGHPCGADLSVTWNVDGADPERIETVSGGTTLEPAACTFSRVYPPGVHGLTVSVTDGLADPVIFTSTITVLTPAIVSLQGIVSDDGLPLNAALAVGWNLAEGPADIVISQPESLVTQARFTVPGSYRLRLMADDSEHAASDDLQVYVRAIGVENLPPTVKATSPGEVPIAREIRLAAQVLDDGAPTGTINLDWVQVSGPGNATVAPATGSLTSLPGIVSLWDATVRFDVAGEYVFRVTASDGEFSAADTIRVQVIDAVNQPPVVSTAGSLVATWDAAIGLVGSALDDGLPRGTLLTRWTQVAGPSTAPLHVEDGVTLAACGAPGEYVFRFIADDGEAESAADLIVQVVADVAPVKLELAELAIPLPVTAPVVIQGTVSGGLLESWQLECRPRPALEDDTTDLPPWAVVASGQTPVLEGPIGTFDPTLRLNGLHELRLVATDRTGQTFETDPVSLTVDGKLKLGHFTFSVVDLAVPLAGIPIEITRTYDSRNAATADFGPGWTLDLRGVQLRKSRLLARNWSQTSVAGWYTLEPRWPRHVTVAFPGDTLYRFETILSPNLQFGYPIASVTVSFRPLPGTVAQLEIEGDSIASVDGYVGPINLIDFFGFAFFEPTRFRLTTPEGDVYVIDEQHGLEEVRDRYGHSLRINPDGIVHSSGVAVTFSRDAQGRITQILDPAGERLEYTYDNLGRLTAVTDRTQAVTRYAYEHPAVPHYLTQVVDPRGIAAVRAEYDNHGRLHRQIDAQGQALEFHHDLAQRQQIVRNRLGHATVYAYDDRGNILRLTNPLGQSTTFAYDEYDYCLSRTDPLGHITRYSYDAQGNRLSETDPLGHTTRFTYNPYRQITSITDARGRTLTNEFDGAGNLAATVDPGGNRTTFLWVADRLLALTNALGQVTRFGFDSQGQLTNRVDPLGHPTHYSRDANGRVTREITTRSTDAGLETLVTQYLRDSSGRLLQTVFPDGSSVATEFNALGQPASTVDPLGRVTRYSYDLAGHLERIVYADGAADGYAHDAEGRCIAHTNRLGHVTRFHRDPLGRLETIEYADGAQATRSYDAAGRLEAVADPRGYVTRFGYDAAGRLVAVTNALGRVTRAVYDEIDNLPQLVDPLGRVTQFEYDALDRCVRVLAPDGTIQQTQYDALGQVHARVDAAGQMTAFAYDAAGRLVAVTNALGQSTRLEYNELGQCVRQIDAAGRATAFAYDALGRRIARQLPLGMVQTCAYDAAGNLIRLTDFNGFTTAYRYDLRDRLTEIIPDPRRAEPSLACGYDALGQLVEMADASGLTTWTYDSRQRLARKTVQWSDPALSLSLAYTYDPAGNVASVESSTPSGLAVTYEYDPVNRLTAVNDWTLVTEGSGGSLPRRTVYHYDPAGNFARIDYPTGSSAFLEHDQLDRLTNLALVHPALGPLAQFETSRAVTGHRLTAADSLVLDGATSTLQHSYTYDPLDRLESEWIEDVQTSSAASLEYRYDPAGNRLDRSSTLASLPSSTHSYDDNDRLLEHVYDNNGNTLSATFLDPVTQLPTAIADTYDFENRLVSRQSPTGTVRFAHNAAGQRTTKTTDTGAATTITRYLIDDLNPTRLPQVIEEWTATGPTSPALDRIYVYGRTLLAQHHLASDNPGDPLPDAETCFYGLDGQGSVRFLTDSQGRIIECYDYDAFGNLIRAQTWQPATQSWSPLSAFDTAADCRNRHLFRAERFDPHLGLYHLRARDYHPDLGRFWTMDPHEGRATDPPSLHKYLYARSDPVNRIDPAGYESLLTMSLAAHFGRSLHLIYDGSAFSVGMGVIAALEGVAAGKESDDILIEYEIGALLGAVSGWTLSKVVQLAGGVFKGNIRLENLRRLPHSIRQWLNGNVLRARQILHETLPQYGKSPPKSPSPEYQNWGGAVWEEGVAQIESSAEATALGGGTQLEFSFVEGLQPQPWPPNYGFVDKGKATLLPGTLLDRFGSDIGSFASPVGTPFWKRSLPASYVSKQYSVFEVMEPIEVEAGFTAPAFGMPGYGMQFMFETTIQDLLDKGILTLIKRGP